MLHPFETQLSSSWPPDSWGDVTVLLAVSGGADSVALLRAMAAIRPLGRGGLVIGHFNHRLRGDESTADEQFVVQLCRRLDIPCEVGHGGRLLVSSGGGDGIEGAARKARYRFLRQTAARLGARYVATAHTADDQAETVLHRIVRGTGIGGLAGMARARPLGEAATLIRPFLTFRREAVRAYLNDLGQTYRTDASNRDTRFTRNRIRHDLLPKLAADFNPAVVDALLRLGALAGEAQAVVAAAVGGLAERCVTTHGSDTVGIDAAALGEPSRYLVRELLMRVWRDRGWPMQAMGFAQWDQLADLIDACRIGRVDPSQKRTLPGNVLAEPQPGTLLLRRTPP